MGASSADYITRLERENALLAQRRNEAVKGLDSLINRLGSKNLVAEYQAAKEIQQTLRGQ